MSIVAQYSAVSLAVEPFSVVILPDTQFYTCGPSNMLQRFEQQVDWIVSNRVVRNIQAVLHVGDITESNSPPEWARASNLVGRLYANNIPCILAIGNHDLGTNGMAQTRQTLFNDYFPWAAATSRPYWGGSFETGKLENAYYYLTLGGVNWLVLVLEFGPRNVVLDWANQVLSQNEDRAVMVLTHAHVASDNTLHGSDPSHKHLPRHYSLDHHAGYPNNGAEVWNKLIRRHRRAAFVFSGHVLAPSGGARCIMTGDYGNVVYQLMSNYQHFNGGDGYLRVMTFVPDDARVDVVTYSPFLGAFRLDSDNTFTLRQVYAFDSTPPAAVSNITWTPMTAHRGRVTWEPAWDAESGISSYLVFLNGVQVGITRSNQFLLTQLSEQVTYTAAVQAVNGAGWKSSISAPLLATTPPDLQPPKISDIQTGGNKIKVWFSEPLDPQTAVNDAYYRLSNGRAITQAFWNGVSNLVTLFAEPLTPLVTYRLSIDGVRDNSAARNMATGLVRRFVAQPYWLWEEFERGHLSGWNVVDEGSLERPSLWRVSNGVLRQDSNIFGPDGGAVTNRRGTYVYWNATEALSWSQYVFEVTIRTADDDGIGVVFHYQNRSNYCKLDMDAQRFMRKVFEMVDGQETTLAFSPEPYVSNTDMVLRLEVDGRNVRVHLDGMSVFTNAVETATLATGTIGLYCWGSQGVEFKNIRVIPLEGCAAQESDSDEDGMEDQWERLILLRRPDEERETICDVQPWDDSDGDGQLEAEEFVAGTDPLDPHSYFKCEIRRDDSGTATLTWRTVPNRVCDILCADSLLGVFTNYVTNLVAQTVLNSFELPEGPPFFFSVRVRLAP